MENEQILHKPQIEFLLDRRTKSEIEVILGVIWYEIKL